MNNKDKQLIADYMELIFNPARMSLYEYKDGREFKFNSTDASFCVQEMQKRGEIDDFTKDALMICLKTTKVKALPINFTSWLMSMEDGVAKNFFKAFTEWRKTK